VNYVVVAVLIMAALVSISGQAVALVLADLYSGFPYTTSYSEAWHYCAVDSVYNHTASMYLNMSEQTWYVGYGPPSIHKSDYNSSLAISPSPDWGCLLTWNSRSFSGDAWLTLTIKSMGNYTTNPLVRVRHSPDPDPQPVVEYAVPSGTWETTFVRKITFGTWEYLDLGVWYGSAQAGNPGQPAPEPLDPQVTLWGSLSDTAPVPDAGSAAALLVGLTWFASAWLRKPKSS
jgi:hypothetical protein